MKKLVLTSLISATFSFGQALAEGALELEPSINGEVSASGLYATQAEEDHALSMLSEPCIYGEQAASSSSYIAKTQMNVARERRVAKIGEKSESRISSDVIGGGY